MKRSFLLLCTVLLVLGCALPCAAYRLACMALVVQGTAPSAAEAASVTSEESSRVAPSPADTADTVCFTDQSTGQTITLPLREYLIGAVAAEMPVSWPDEALKAQAVAAHSYALYRRDHSTGENGAWFTADPARRQGCLTDAVLHSYWGTAYAANYARLSALVDAVQTQVLYYEDAPAGTSYFAMSNGRTEASEKVWGTALPYLVPVDSSTDTAADNYEYTLNLSAAQLQQLLAERLGIAADLSQQAQWFGTPVLTPSGYVDSLPVCGQALPDLCRERRGRCRAAGAGLRWRGHRAGRHAAHRRCAGADPGLPGITPPMHRYMNISSKLHGAAVELARLRKAGRSSAEMPRRTEPPGLRIG